jgi:hypothetical protein
LKVGLGGDDNQLFSGSLLGFVLSRARF